MEPELVERWTDAGKLPNIEHLRRDGAYGTTQCRSLVSARQWTTHFTGVDAERHGISGFRKRNQNTTDSIDSKGITPQVNQLINLSDIPVLTYPELLNQASISSGLINPMPLWPPLELNKGYCVSGMLTPPDSDQWYYPEDIDTILDDEGYRIDIKYGNRPYGFVDDDLLSEVNLETLRDDMFDVLRCRIETTKRLMSERPTDFTYVLLKSIDVIQHVYWAHMKMDSSKFNSTIFNSYQMVDDFVGWIRDNIDDSTMIVFSDHGFGAKESPPPAIETIGRRAANLLPTIPTPLRRVYKSFASKNTAEPGDLEQLTGDHSSPAVWMLGGSKVESASEVTVNFEDLTPTILALLEVDIPREYIGTPISTVLSVEPQSKSVDLETTRNLSIEPNDVVTDRLHNLGYADFVE
jgi:predicted AlkP superfamily phosphohydrolase/phosphomutase